MSGATGRRLYVLVGPTATGKSAVAQYIAEQRDAAVLSADSMLIYRGMDIGTAKPALGARGRVPYLGVDLANPDEGFSVWQYRQAAVAQLATLPPSQEVIVVGGSGLYVHALIMGLDTAGEVPAARAQWETLFATQGIEGLRAALRARAPAALAALADPRNPRRLIRALERGAVPAPAAAPTAAVPVLAGLRMEPALLNRRIEQRVARMYAAGLLNEVAGLLAAPRGLSPTALQAIGYAEAIAVLEGRCSRETAIAQTVARTCRLAKRQRTWFRHQARVEWVDAGAADTVASLAARVQEIWRTHGNTNSA